MKEVRLYRRGMFLYAMLLLFTFTTVAVQAESYPAQCRVTTTLNVRQGPGTGYYKIGKPYVEPPCCDSCCKCQPTQSTKCVCCPKVEIVKRIYMDIFNMFDQRVGKFVSFHDVNGCCCCETHNEFYEIYFPADANLMLRLALIGQMIFFFHFGTNLFGSLPGSSDDIGQFIV